MRVSTDESQEPLDSLIAWNSSSDMESESHAAQTTATGAAPSSSRAAASASVASHKDPSRTHAAAAHARSSKHHPRTMPAVAQLDDDMEEEEEEAEGSGGEAAAAASSVSSRIPPGHPRALWTEGYAYGVRIMSDRLSVRYVQRAVHQLDVGTVRSADPLPKAAAAAVCYFEVSVIDSGQRQQMTIGVAPLHSSCLFAPADMHARDTPVPAQASRTHHPTASNSCRQVGMDVLSYGYRADEGHKFHGPSVVAGRPALNGTAYGPAFGAGDVVGCGLNYYDGSVFFTHNGRNLGAAFHLKPDEWTRVDHKAPDVRQPSARSIDFYAVVSLHSKGEHVKLNFGQTPFMFDVAAFEDSERQRVQRQISAIPFDSTLMLPLIRSYLLHQGYEKSLEALRDMSGGVGGDTSQAAHAPNGHDASMKDAAASSASAAAPVTAAASSSSSSPQTRHDVVAALTMQDRRVIRDLIESGDIETAMVAIQKLAPALWSQPDLTSLSSPLTAQQLHLRLLSLHFISLLSSTSATRVLDAISFAQRQLLPFQNCGDDSLRVEVERLMGLLAYPDVQSSPLAHLLSDEYRADTATHVNAAILASLCTPARAAANVHGVSSLELVLRHALALDAVLKQQACPVALPDLLGAHEHE